LGWLARWLAGLGWLVGWLGWLAGLAGWLGWEHTGEEIGNYLRFFEKSLRIFENLKPFWIQQKFNTFFNIFKMLN
jgi:hypothetical protein